MQIKSKKYSIDHLPIAPTPEGEKSIQGSQFDFIELLKDKVAKQVHCYTRKYALTKYTYIAICTTYEDTMTVTLVLLS